MSPRKRGPASKRAKERDGAGADGGARGAGGGAVKRAISARGGGGERPGVGASLRHWAGAAAQAGAGVGLVDAAIATRGFATGLGSLGERVRFALALAAALAAALAGVTLLVSALAALVATRVPERARPALVQFVAIASGLGAGFAIFSGTAMRRSPARPWAILATAAFVALCAQLLSSRRAALSARREQHPLAARLGLLAASASLYLAHAWVLVRLYPAVHAIAAAGALVALVAAQGLGPPASPARGDGARAAWVSAVGLAVVGAIGAAALLDTQTTRAFARQSAPVGAYLVRLLAPLAPRAPSVAPVAHSDHAALAPAGSDALALQGADIVLVTVDALRPDRLGAYGGPRDLTPNIDAMASRGVLFERVYCTTPHTSYSLASLMTGKYFREVSARFPGRAHDTLPALLSRAGYVTAGFFPPAVFNVDGERLGALRSQRFDLEFVREGYADAATRVREVGEYLAGRERGQPVFVWVHLFEPHEPYDAPPRPGDTGRFAAYDGEVARVDTAVGALRELWASRGRRALVVLTADHGEEFGEHGGRFHGTTVFDEQVRVPLVIEGPGVAAGRREGGVVSLLDVMPTLLAAVGAPLPATLRGRALGAALRAGERDAGEGSGLGARPVFASAGDASMVVDGSEKLACDLGEGSCELFDLGRDPGEQRNLVDERAARAAVLRGLLEDWEASHARVELARAGAGADGGISAPLPAAVERALQGDAAAAPEVAALLPRLSDASVLRVAARALAALDVRTPAVRDALAAARAHAGIDAQTARSLGVALALLGDGRGAEATREALAHPRDEAEARDAALGLARLGDHAGVPVLLVAARATSLTDRERDAVVAALAALREPRAFDTWVALLDDARLAPAAASALGALGDARAVAALERVADSTRYALTRRAALGALAALGESRAVVARLRSALAAPDPLPDALALARAVGEPGRALCGASGSRALRPDSALVLALTGAGCVAASGGAAWVVLGFDAPAARAFSVAIDGAASGPTPVPVGAREVRIPLAPGARVLRLRADAPATLAGALLVARAP